MLRIAVCDDEDTVCSAIERYIQDACTALSIESEIDIFTTGTGFTRYLGTNERYNIIFLDIELDEYSGIDVSNYIRNVLNDETTQIVYITGKTEYDRQLFTFRPFEFLAKPLSTVHIFDTIKKYQRIYGSKNDLFHYKYGHDTYWVNLNEIMYFKSIDRKVLIKKTSSDDEFYAKLESIKEQLQDCGFISPHKSYLLNYRYIQSFRPDCIIMTNGEEIPIAKGRKKEIAYLQLMLENGGYNGS